jgi:integral membrane protein
VACSVESLYPSALMRALRQLRVVAFLEGLSFILLLFVAMPLKYMAGLPLAVRVTGSVHGVLFVAFVYVLLRAATEHDWPIKRSAGAFVASLVPFGTFVLDRALKREIERGAG